MTADELAELQQHLTTRAVASRLRGNRRDNHLDVAMHLLESLRTASQNGLESDWGNLTDISFKSEGQDHRDYQGDIIARSVFATHHTITFTYRN